MRARPTRYAKNVLKADDQTPYPPKLSPAAVFVLTVISGGIFLWVWALMWGSYIKKVRPDSFVGALAYVNIVPAALLSLNISGLVLAVRQNDETQIARMQISLALWGMIALVCLIATGIAIFLAQRQIGMPTRHKP